MKRFVRSGASVLASMVIFVPVMAFAKGAGAGGYEVWGADQSNSVRGASGRGVEGSYIWVWDGRDIRRQIAGGPDAAPLGCDGRPGSVGPCDLREVFPPSLREVDARGRPTGRRLSDLSGFGRLHGMIQDPQNLYLNVNVFAPGGGFVGVIDRRTRAAVALFRVTGTNVGGGTDVRSVHMSFWSADGSALLVANLNGKLLERIDVRRDRRGNITDLVFNRSATLGVGRSMAVTTSATAFRGRNALGRRLLGRVGGSYARADLSDLTPNGKCKENGCTAGPDGARGGRPNNVIICPITSDDGNAYITTGGGGLLVARIHDTPMAIVGEYGNEVVNGAGCGGGQQGPNMWLNAGVSASGAGATWSTFTMYTIDDTGFPRAGRRANPENTPAPQVVFRDPGNTATGGQTTGPATNPSGQLPGVTTRRDAHGLAVTVNGRYAHVVDRIQNVVEVFDTRTGARSTYDLTSADGQGLGAGPCAARSVTDDPGLPANDPAPDLMEVTPDGRYLVIAFRGPTPVSVTHSAQGSCPGVGIVELLQGGRTGRLVTVLRTTNTVDDAPVSAPGGHPYVGAERSDVHGATVVRKRRVAPRPLRPGR